MTNFRDIFYFYPLQEQFARNLLFNQGVSFLSLKKKYSLHTKMTSFILFVFFFHILVTLRFEILQF